VKHTYMISFKKDDGVGKTTLVKHTYMISFKKDETIFVTFNGF
jgi:hypothetical protein